MATTPYTWAIITIITVLAVQSCLGEKSCTIWSSVENVGNVVQRGSNLTVYCTFTCKGTCKKSMSKNGKISWDHRKLNSSTLYLNVTNIVDDRSTYSCRCNNCRPHDPCGIDIVTAFSPDIPDDIKCKCNQNLTHSEVREVVCTWHRGKDTFLRNTSNKLWVRTISGYHKDEPKPYASTSNGSGWLNANFKVNSSVQEISMWVHANNTLGSVVSTVYNFTISNIVMPSPPVLTSAECSSRSCEIKVERAQMTQYLEMQYRITNQQTWKTFSNSTSPLRVWSVSSLEPITQYDFRARTRFSTGLWSQWSKSMTNTTQEEAPKELDVWYCKASSESSSITVHWKRVDASNVRGNISGYTVRVHNPNTGIYTETYLPHPASRHSVESCVSCEVTVFANNSKGQSPPAKISTLHKNTGEPPQGVHVIVNNGSVAISWRKPETTGLHTGYLVEWYPSDQKKELQWVRLGKDNNHMVIPDMKKSECYDGAVYAFYEGSVGRYTFMDVSTSDSVPTGGPLVKVGNVNGEWDRVTVTWSEIPRDQREGCISNYTIYIRNINEEKDLPPYHIRSSEMMYTVKDLAPGSYTLRMTGWNAKGEGPQGPVVLVDIIQQDYTLMVMVTVVVLVAIPIIMVLLCMISALRRRILGCCMPDTVPDPANSKWARECSIEKGKLNLLLQLSTSSGSEEEEDEPSTVEVEELQVESSSTNSSSLGVAATDVSSVLLLPQASLSPVTEPAEVQQYLHTSYIKSYSQESDSSDYTHSSRDTTVDYVSSHRSCVEEEQNEEDEEDCMDVMGFFPSDGPFLDSVVCGGKLTLDAVKIDCSDFFHNA